MNDRYRELAALLAREGAAERLTITAGERLGAAVHRSAAGELLCSDEEKRIWAQTDEKDILCERLYAARRLIICGGGHISLPVSELGDMLGYETVVLDDRAEFAQKARFPHADRVLCGPFDELLGQELSLRQGDSFVVVTRGHQADETCVAAILSQVNPLYIGMIGSKRKNAAVFDRLWAKGFTDAQLSQVHAPIGLSIGAQTPAEIAVAIAAEIISERSGGENEVMPREMLRALTDGDGKIMATVVRKQGSAPRGAGARMLLLRDGSFIGTVGGGAAEGAVMETMRAMPENAAPKLRTFTMHTGSAAELGLICGGEIDVLLEPVA